MTTNLKRLAKSAPEAERHIKNQLLAIVGSATEPMTFAEIMAWMDCSMLPEKPVADQWGSNPFEPSVIVMDVLAKLIEADTLAEIIGGTLTYSLSLGGFRGASVRLTY